MVMTGTTFDSAYRGQPGIPESWDEYEANIGKQPGYDAMDQRSMRAIGEHELADRWAAISAQGSATETVSRGEELLAPAKWDEFIGQKAAINDLEVRSLSAKLRHSPIPATLLVGPPGTGKTTLAGLVAAELDRPLVTFSKPPKNTDALIDALWSVQNGVVLFDEVHLFTGRQQHDLMDLTESGTLQGSGWTSKFPGLSIIMATTEPGQLNGPLLSRMMCRPPWVDYTEAEMVQIVRGMASRAHIPDHLITPELAVTIARASAGTPRTSRLMVLAARDLLAAERPATGADVLTFCQIEPDGLTVDHMRYLRELAQSHRGTAGITALITILQIAAKEVRTIERLLVERRYVALTSTGRQITPAGRDRLAQGAS